MATDARGSGGTADPAKKRLAPGEDKRKTEYVGRHRARKRFGKIIIRRHIRVEGRTKKKTD